LESQELVSEANVCEYAERILMEVEECTGLEIEDTRSPLTED